MIEIPAVGICRLLTTCAVGAILVTSVACATGNSASGTAAEINSAQSTAVRASMPGAVVHDSFTINSTVLAEPRLVNVHVPAEYPTSRSRKFAVLYMPDGGMDEDFPHIVHAVDSLAALGLIQPTIVVGIPNTQRRRDLTGPTRVARDSAIAPRVGGSAEFRTFIRDELMPAVESRYRVSDDRSIIGESLAGLFIVETFLLEPSLFRHYVALDPSLWWNSGELLESAASRLRQAKSSPRTLFLASSVDDVDGLTGRLDAVLRASPPRQLTWSYTPRPDATHATIFLATQAAALTHALRR